LDTRIVDHTTYNFHLDFWADSFTVIVKNTADEELWNVTVIDGDYQSGQFGFYNYSQENVQYSGFADTTLGLAVIDPNPLHYKMAHLLNPLTGAIAIGSFSGRTAGEIDVTSLSINESLVPDSVSLVESWPGFSDSVLIAYLKVADFINLYDPDILWDTVVVDLRVAGLFDDGAPFIANGSAEIMSHRSGDVNLDGAVNVQDLLLLVDMLFHGGSAQIVMSAADVNHDGAVNVADLTELVRILFL